MEVQSITAAYKDLLREVSAGAVNSVLGLSSGKRVIESCTRKTRVTLDSLKVGTDLMTQQRREMTDSSTELINLESKVAH